MALSEAGAEVLSALGLEAGPPEPRLFEDLFLRFTRVVPYERLSAREGPPRTPDEVLAGHAEGGSGAAGVERAAAFRALAAGLAFDVAPVATEQGGPLLLATLLGRRLVADVATPLGVLVPLDAPAREIAGPTGRLSLERTGGTFRLVEEARGERAEVWRTELRACDGDDAWRDPDGPLLLRLHDDRRVGWDGAELEIVDAWSRLRYPLRATDGDVESALESLFGWAPGPLPASTADAAPSATLAVYDGTELEPAGLLAELATPAGHRRLLPPGVTAQAEARDGAGWTWRLVGEDGRFLRRDRVEPRTDGAVVTTLEGESPIARRQYRVLPGRLELTATLSRPVPPRGPVESVRKTLVFHLVSELLALATDRA